MRYMMKQNLWSLGGEFTIQDEHQQDAFKIFGRALSWGDKLSFQDMDGAELAFISQKLMRWNPTYEIHRNGSKFAEVVKEISFFKSQFTLDVPGPNDYTISGSFWEHEFTFERDEAIVANVSKELWSWADTIDVVDGEDDVAILATCVVIDILRHVEKA